MKNNKRTKSKIKHPVSLVKLTIIILIFWVIGLLVGIGIVNIVSTITKNNLETKTFLLTLAFGGGSVLVAIPIAILITKKSIELVSIINSNLDRIAKGDFTTKYYHKSKNAYIQEVVNNYNQMVDQLNSVALLKENFVSTFSHEFKTPMVSIKGYAELLNNFNNLTDEEREYLKVIIEESKRLSYLAENTLLLTKLDSQSFLTTKKKFLLNAQLEDCIILFDNQFKDKKIEINADIKSIRINGDQDLIKQIWINLINNAIKYSKENSIVEIKAFKENDYAVVKVKDYGIGMDGEVQSHIFEKFYQADIKHSSGGLGLGLSIVKRIVNLSKGTITFTSEVDKGSEFVVRLPL